VTNAYPGTSGSRLTRAAGTLQAERCRRDAPRVTPKTIVGVLTGHYRPLQGRHSSNHRLCEQLAGQFLYGRPGARQPSPALNDLISNAFPLQPLRTPGSHVAAARAIVMHLSTACTLAGSNESPALGITSNTSTSGPVGDVLSRGERPPLPPAVRPLSGLIAKDRDRISTSHHDPHVQTIAAPY